MFASRWQKGKGHEGSRVEGRFCKQCLEVAHIVSLHLIGQNSVWWPHLLARGAVTRSPAVVPRTRGNRCCEELASLPPLTYIKISYTDITNKTLW